MYRNTFNDNGYGPYIHFSAIVETGLYNELYDNVIEDNCFGFFAWSSTDYNIRFRGSNQIVGNELMGASFMRASYLSAEIGTFNDYSPVDWQCNTCPVRDDFPDEEIVFEPGVERAEGGMTCSFDRGTVIRDNDVMVAGQVQFWGRDCRFRVLGDVTWSTYLDLPGVVDSPDGPVEADCHPGPDGDYYFEVSPDPDAPHGIADPAVSPFVFNRCGGGPGLLALQDLELGDDVLLRTACRDWNQTWCVMAGEEDSNACTTAHAKWGRCCPADDLACQRLRDGECGEERWPVCCYCQPQDEECFAARYMDFGYSCCEPTDAACHAEHPDWPDCAHVVLACCAPEDLTCQARHPDYELCCDASDASCTGHVTTCQ